MRFQIAVLILVFLAFSVRAQESVKPPGEGATRAEIEKWISVAIDRHASYSTRTMEVTIADVKFERCTISYTEVRKSSSRNNSVAVTAVIKQKSIKLDLDVDLSKLALNGIEITDHILPEFQTLVLRERYDTGGATTGRDVELVVKHGAADAMKIALERLKAVCSSTN
jgi:hypothetical protein